MRRRSNRLSGSASTTARGRSGVDAAQYRARASGSSPASEPMMTRSGRSDGATSHGSTGVSCDVATKPVSSSAWTMARRGSESPIRTSARQPKPGRRPRMTGIPMSTAASSNATFNSLIAASNISASVPGTGLRRGHDPMFLGPRDFGDPGESVRAAGTREAVETLAQRLQRVGFTSTKCRQVLPQFGQARRRFAQVLPLQRGVCRVEFLQRVRCSSTHSGCAPARGRRPPRTHRRCPSGP